MKAQKVYLFLFIFLTPVLVDAKIKYNVLPGAYQTDSYFPLLRGKTIGVVANQTSMIGKMHLVDSLKRSGFNIKCVFAPEHGFRGNKANGEHIDSSVDELTGIPIVSLYGKHMKPDQEDLKGIDIVLFDIQDVGVRFYTYISTLQYVMEACIDYDVQLMVLDRPNPNGYFVDGPVLEPRYKSFVGMQAVPIVYGMTIGEYASMIDGEGWVNKKKKCNLVIVPIRNYNHKILYQLPVPPSPNLPEMDAVYLYPSICLFEGTRISLGRGTNKPFCLIGFPDSVRDGITFVPVDLPGMAMNPPYEDTICTGRELNGDVKRIISEQKIQLSYLKDMYARYPAKDNFFSSFFDKLAGNSTLRKQIIENKSEEEIRKSWKDGIDNFKKIRSKYLQYRD